MPRQDALLPEPIHEDALRRWLTEPTLPPGQPVVDALTAELQGRMKLGPMDRKIPWTKLAVGFLCFGGDAEWGFLVKAFTSNEYDHYLLQQSSGVSKDDLGAPPSDARSEGFLRGMAAGFLRAIEADRARSLLAGLGVPER